MRLLAGNILNASTETRTFVRTFLDNSAADHGLSIKLEAISLAGALHHARSAGRKLLEMDAARFVRAVLRPHHREDSQLRVVRRAAEDLFDAAIFLLRQPVRRNHLGRNFHQRDFIQKITPSRA